MNIAIIYSVFQNNILHLWTANKATQLWNHLLNNLSNNTASQFFRNKLKLLLIYDQM